MTIRFLPLAALALAQIGIAQMSQNANPQDGTPRPEIRGAIRETGTGYGVAGLQVSLTLDGQPASTASVTVTDGQGAYVFHPNDFGHYQVKVDMGDYRVITDLSHIDQNLNNPARVVITHGNPSETVSFNVARPAEIIGRVIDEETSLPLAKFPVTAVAVMYSKGRRSSGIGGGLRAITDEEGRFSLSVMPGKFVVETLPRSAPATPFMTENSGSDRIMTVFTETDQNAVDEDYERTFWPGGRDIDSASPIPITGGQTINAGTIKVRKVVNHRVRVIFPAANCTPADRVAMRFGPDIYGDQVLSAEVPCGKDFLIRDVEPGSYKLTLETQRTPETRTQATASVEVGQKNLDVTVSLQPGVDLNGRVIFPEGVPRETFDRLLVFAGPERAIFASGRPMPPDALGAFQVPNAPWGRMNVSLTNLAGGYYVREIRYAGNPIPGNSFMLSRDVPSQSVEIVIDDKPALVSGVVSQDDQPLNKPYVVLVKWPYSSEIVAQSVKEANGDEAGNFRFAGLAPGDYRLIAVPQDNKGKLDEPGVLERLFVGATKLTLARGDRENVTLKPSDPAH